MLPLRPHPPLLPLLHLPKPLPRLPPCLLLPVTYIAAVLLIATPLRQYTVSSILPQKESAISAPLRTLAVMAPRACAVSRRAGAAVCTSM